jgi:hypothetical protein
MSLVLRLRLSPRVEMSSLVRPVPFLPRLHFQRISFQVPFLQTSKIDMTHRDRGRRGSLSTIPSDRACHERAEGGRDDSRLPAGSLFIHFWDLLTDH